MRFDNFKKSLKEVEAHPGMASAGYEIGLNHFSDWTRDEITAIMGFIPHEDLTYPSDHPMVGESIENRDVKNLPKSVDWSAYQTPVRTQGNCGSCYAHTVLGLLESINMIKGGKNEWLSI